MQSGTPGWMVTTGVDESGPYTSISLDLRAFTRWYMAQPQGQDGARHAA